MNDTLIFAAGAFAGSIVTICVMALLTIAKQSDHQIPGREVDKHG